MKNADRWGFTLIELLTVIAIIAILAGMVFTVGPPMIERAKITSFSNTCNQIRTSCVGYFTKYRDTYPPGYGYQAYPKLPAESPDNVRFCLMPYMARLGLLGNKDCYDVFSQSYDTDKDGAISWLEFSPVGVKDSVDPTRYDFPLALYRENLSAPAPYTASGPGGRTFNDEVTDQKNSSPRPIIYIPVYRDDALKAVKYWQTLAKTNLQAGWYALQWDANFFQGQNSIRVPPPKYDDFVLIGVGPSGSTGGLLTPPQQFIGSLKQAGITPDEMYYYFALRTYFLATRDADGDYLWDFDFRNRTRKGEAKILAAFKPGMNLNLLPDGTNGGGPLIYLPNDNGLIGR